MDKKFDVGKAIIKVLGGVTLLVTLTTVGLWLFGQHVAASIVGTATLFSWLALLSAVLIVVVSWWSATLMERGAKIALAAQVSDDRRDEQLLRTVADLSKTWRQIQGDLPALPMPGQRDWLAPFEEGEFTDMN